MARTQVMTIPQFLSGEWKKPSKQQTKALINSFATSAGSVAIFLPHEAYAAAVEPGGALDGLFPQIMVLFDIGIVIVIAFAGAIWATGHRPKALEILLGACIGYVLARHAVDIRDFLKRF